MKIIVSGRRCGKTTKLIENAGKEFAYIICRTVEECSRIAQQAKEMGVCIPFPLSYEEFTAQRYRGRGVKGFCIDDIPAFFQYISPGVPIIAGTIPGNIDINWNTEDTDTWAYQVWEAQK